MKRKVIYIVLLILFQSIGFAQTKTQLVNEGDKSFHEGDFYGSGSYYKMALDYDSLDTELVMKYAEALRLQNNYQKAEYYYGKIYLKDGGREYPKAVFWLATMQKINGDYLGSYKTWKRVKTIYRKSNSYENQKAKQEIRASAFARRAEKYRNEAVVKNIGEGVNTVASEFNPVVKDNQLFFSSLRTKKVGLDRQVLDEIYKVKLYKATIVDSNWKTEDDLPLTINSPQFHNANSCFSADETQFYFTRCDENNRCKLIVSSYKDGKWGSTKELKLNSASSTTTQPMSFYKNGKEYLFFVSDRKGGFGKLDIWYTKRKENGSFETPINAGEQVNSIDNEITPFYDLKKSRLYFSSDWHVGLGGFDIFESLGNPDRLTRPKNLGMPINSRWNDMYYFVDTITDTNYLASNREGSLTDKNATCCNDIYSVAFPEEIKPEEIEILTLEDINKYLPVTLYFHNDCPNPRTTKTTTELNYLTTYVDYMELVPTYKTEYSKGLQEMKEEEAILDIDDFFKDYVEKGVKDLDLFTQLLFLELEKGIEIELTVKGFASPLAKTDYNVKLTGRRISSLKNFLNEFENGKFKKYINSSKLSFKEEPFGEYTASKLVSDNVNDQRNSVYSRAAALERKIEIVSVSYKIQPEKKAPKIKLDKEYINLGKRKNGIPIEVKFSITNEGNAPLIIFGIEGSCSCTVVKNDETPLLSGESRIIKAAINTEQLFGKLTKTVTIKSNAIPKDKTVIINFEIIKNN